MLVSLKHHHHTTHCYDLEVAFIFCGCFYTGLLSLQCGGMARKLQSLQIQPGELHGHQLCGL